MKTAVFRSVLTVMTIWIFKEGEIIKIRRSEQQLSIIDINGSSFYKAVHNKLMRPLK